MLEFRDKGTSRTQFAVLSGEAVIATIYMDEQVWNWTFRLSAGPPGFTPHGSAPSLDEAKAAVESQWAHWLAAAGFGYI